MKNTTYDTLKATTTLGLPAVGALYFGLSETWGLPAGEQVVGTLALLTTFCGVVLRIISKQYYNSDAPYDGNIVVEEREDGGKQFSLELGLDPSTIPDLSAVNFKVQQPSNAPFRGIVQPEDSAGH